MKKILERFIFWCWGSSHRTLCGDAKIVGLYGELGVLLHEEKTESVS